MPHASRVNLRHELDRVRRTRGERLSLDRIGVAIAAAAGTLLMFQLIASARGGDPMAADGIAGLSPDDYAASPLPPHLRERLHRRFADGLPAGLAGSGGAGRESGEAGGAVQFEVEYGWAGPDLLVDDGTRSGAFEVRLLSAEFDGSAPDPSDTEIVAEDRWVEYRRGTIVEWYGARRGALEQGFTIDSARLVGELRLRLTLGAVLKPGPGVGAASAGAPHAGSLRYAGIRARDADGDALPVRMQVAGKEMTLTIDTRGAAYPVVVGPMRLEPQPADVDSGPP